MALKICASPMIDENLKFMGKWAYSIDRGLCTPSVTNQTLSQWVYPQKEQLLVSPVEHEGRAWACETRTFQ